MKKKNLKKQGILGLVFFVFVSFQMLATAPAPSIALKKVNAKAFRLYVKTLDDQATVEIKNQSGKIMLTEVLPKGYVYRKTYDISDLPEETYYVKISDLSSVKEFAVLKDSVKLILDEKKNTEEA
jgi:hypothetical protein